VKFPWGKTYLKALLRLKDFAFRVKRRRIVSEPCGVAVPLSEATSKLKTVDMGIYSIAKEFFDWTEVTGTQGKE